MNPIALPQVAKLFWYNAHLIEKDMHAVKCQGETMVPSATVSPGPGPADGWGGQVHILSNIAACH